VIEHLNQSEQAPERAVVMGAGGFVGGAILRKLKQRGVATLALTRAEIDLLATGAGERLAALLRPSDAFVAVSAIAPCTTPARLRENITIAETLAAALTARPVAQILNIGSDAVYADSPKALTEQSCTAPGSLHGVMHLTREIMLRDAAGDTPFVSLRPTLIYGIEDPHNGYGPNRFRRLAAKGEDIVLFGEGEERRDHIFVEDVAELAARIVMRCSSGVLNAATGTVMSFRDAADLVASLFERPVTIRATPRKGPMPHNGYRPFDPVATFAAFPDFRYVQPADGFARVHAAMVEAS
jgi:nucleoside-diphosphate-sugar epimerase